MKEEEKSTEKDSLFFVDIVSVSGMYEVLKLVVILLAKYQEGITKKEIACICNLPEQTISQNLSRLVKANILEMIESHGGSKGRTVKYKLKDNGGKTIDFIIKSLYS